MNVKKSKYVQIFLYVLYKLLQYKINYNLEYGIQQEIAEDKMLRRCQVVRDGLNPEQGNRR